MNCLRFFGRIFCVCLCTAHFHFVYDKNRKIAKIANFFFNTYIPQIYLFSISRTQFLQLKIAFFFLKKFHETFIIFIGNEGRKIYAINFHVFLLISVLSYFNFMSSNKSLFFVFFSVKLAVLFLSTFTHI